MPILEVEIVLRPGEILAGRLAAEVAERAGEVFASPARGTWVKVRTLPGENYAENGAGLPGDIFPVFVTVLKARRPVPEQMQAEVARLAQAIAQACGRPVENVHILYLPEAAGRLAFGGRLVTG